MSPSSALPCSSPTDVVFVDTLHLSVNVGLDCWNRRRPQLAEVSIYLHLQDSSLDKAGTSDNVLDSVHYGHLAKAITKLVEREASFESVCALISAVAMEAFTLAGHAASHVRVVLGLPKLIPLAEGFVVDATLTHQEAKNMLYSKKVTIKDLVLPVIIGVNPPEREAKQRVINNITFLECPSVHEDLDYPAILTDLVKNMEESCHFTLEKYILEVVRAACLSSEHIEMVTVCAQKPSALSFANTSGVQISRRRTAFLSHNDAV